MQERDIKFNPKETANCVSVLLFSWLRKILYTGWKGKLTEEHVYPILHTDHSSLLGSQLERNWFEDVTKCAKTNTRPNFRWTVFRTFSKKYLFYGLFSMLEECVFRIIQVISLGYLIEYFAETPKLRTKTMAWLACSGIILSSLAFTISFHWSVYCTHHVCTHMRLAMSSLIYRKTLKLSQATMRSFSVGQLITMLSNDVHRFDMKELCLNYLWIAPCQLTIVIYMLYYHYDFGLASLGGLLLLVAFVIFQYILSKYVSKVRLHKIWATNKRIRLVTEIMQAFNTIKLYAWENLFFDLSRKTRNEELVHIKKTMILKILNTSLSLILTKMTVFLTILFYVYYDHKPLDPQRVFLTLLLYEHVRINLAFLFSQGANDLAEISVTFVRMTEFLLLEEKYVDPSCYIIEQVPKEASDHLLDSPFKGVAMENVTCKWHQDAETPTLQNITLNLSEGQFIAVVGSIGSGKTSLLSALLGELPILKGTITRQGRICYVSQKPWLFPGTVRQNIIFGRIYNPTWYKEVIEICALKTDIDSLTDGDHTKVIHAGLSVGQKARISLARAVYSNSDIYLMDDPLNSVDVRISRHILENCIRGALKDKAVLLVTHQLHFLEAADNIAILINGMIRAQGTYKELMDAGIEFADEVEDADEQEDLPETLPIKRKSILIIEEEELTHRLIVKEVTPGALDKINPSAIDITSPSTFKVNTLMLKNEVAPDTKKIKTEKIGIKLYWSYVKSSSSWWLIMSSIGLCILAQVIYTLSDIWLEFWIEDEEKRAAGMHNPVTSNKFFDALHQSQVQISIYCSLIPSLVVVTILRGIAMFRICIKSSLTLFCQLLNSLLQAKARFVDTGCSGQGINRFSKDMIVIDELLPTTLYDLTGVFFEILGAVVILGTISWTFLIPCFVYLVLSVLLFKIYHPSASMLKRLEANARSPVYAHTMKTVEGLTSIRAYDQQRIFLKIYEDLQDKHTANWSLYIGTHSWLALYVDWLSILLIAAISISFILFDNYDPAAVGLAIAKVIELSILMQIAVKVAANSETEMIAVERILEYLHEEHEGKWERPENKPPDKWPDKGHIVFENVWLEGPGEKGVSTEISCEIGAGEKIGIVGRSGAGKTTFINALFRLTEPKTGKITIDDINILELGLHDLRPKISVIPQVPHIFTGSLRMNLDPFDESAGGIAFTQLNTRNSHVPLQMENRIRNHRDPIPPALYRIFKDKELWDVLDEVSLFDTVKGLKRGLDTQLTESGWHFSAGQSQLLSLARVMLQKNQIFCCDEATANLDPRTQSLVLKKIKDHFRKCTVIIISHRLHTIIECDKVMVIEAGQIADFGKPYDLILQQGAFYSLVMHLGRKNADDIIRIAKENAMGTRTRRDSTFRRSSEAAKWSDAVSLLSNKLKGV